VLISMSPEPVRITWKLLVMREEVSAFDPPETMAPPMFLPSWRVPFSGARKVRGVVLR